MRGLTFIVAVMSLFYGCDKYENDVYDGPYDTIFPGPYLPVYPGSYWTYNSGAVEYRTSDDFLLHSFLYDEGNLTFESKPCFVPFWRGQPVYRYASPVGWSSDGYSFDYFMINILSEQTGDRWIDSAVGGRHGSFQFYDSVVAVNVNAISGANNYDSVIVVEHYSRYSQSITQKEGTYYYAKNVGLIRVDDKNDSTVLKLDSYFINH